MQVGDVGSEIPRINAADFGYTGQRSLNDMGLMDYRARFYDPTIGRFIQPDTIIPSYANPQALNRFSYVLGNPILLNDPSGNKEACGAFVGDCSYDQAPPPPEPRGRKHHSTLIASSNTMVPVSGQQTYGELAEGSSCGGCPAEGPNGPASTAVGGVGVAADFLGGVQLNSVMNRPPTVFMYLNYSTYEGGSYSVDALRIDNRSNTDLAIRNVIFAVSNPDALPQSSAYNVQRPLYRRASDQNTVGVGIAPRGSVTTIPLTPSHNQNNPNNAFLPGDTTRIVVTWGYYGFNGLNLAPGRFQLP